MTEHHDSAGIVMGKIAIAWGGVGISHLEMLQDLQIGAAALAILYTGAQLFVLIRDKIWKGGK